MGVPLRRGRELTASDVATSSPVVVINQKLAEVIWPSQDPLGEHVNIFGDKQSEVVGIVGNVLHNGLSEPAGAKSYLAFSQNPWFYVAPAIRTRGDQAVFGALALVLSFVGIYGTYLRDCRTARSRRLRRLLRPGTPCPRCRPLGRPPL